MITEWHVVKDSKSFRHQLVQLFGDVTLSFETKLIGRALFQKSAEPAIVTFPTILVVLAKIFAVLLLVVLSITRFGVAPVILNTKLVAVAEVPTFNVPPVIVETDETW